MYENILFNVLYIVLYIKKGTFLLLILSDLTKGGLIMKVIIVGALIFFGFLFYVKIKRKADGKVLVGRARTKIEKGDLEAAKRLIFKAKKKGVHREVIEELIEEYELVEEQ